MRGYLLSLGVPGDRVLAVECMAAVWDGIDWKGSSWKGAGPKVYERFESRVRVALCATTLEGFLGLLARKCGVSTPKVDPTLTRRLQLATPEESAEVLRWLRTMSGVAVAYFRAAKDEAKEERAKARAQKDQLS